MKKTSGNSNANRSRQVPAVRSGSQVRKSAPNSPVEFDYSALGASNTKPKAKTSAKKTSAPSSKKTSKAKGKSLAPAILVSVLAVLIIAGGVLFITGKYVDVINLFKDKITVTMADGTEQKITCDDAYAELNTDVFYDGIVIDGVPVGGMTKDQALAAVSAKQPEAPVTLDYTLKLEDRTFPLDLSSLALNWNGAQVVEQAFAYARPQSEPLTDEDYLQLTDNYNKFQQLKVQGQTFNTAYTVNTDGLQTIVSSIVDPLETSMSDAYIQSFNTDSHAFDVVPESVGYHVDSAATADAVKALIDSATYSGTVDITCEIEQPNVTSEYINANFGLISSYKTVTSNNANRNSNVSQACKYMNGYRLNPGEVFSFNGVVGERTPARGFKEATVILGGQYEKGLGGGICQVSSTLYNAVLMANLKIVDRSSHAWPSSYVDEGRDATVDWGSIDFKFENNTDFQIFIVAYWDPSDSTCHAEIYGKRLPNGEYIRLEREITSRTPTSGTEYVANGELPAGQTNTVRAGHDGVTAVVYKVWYDANGTEIKREEANTTVYRMYAKRVEVGTLLPDGSHAPFDATTGTVTMPQPTETTPSETPPPETTPAPTESSTTAPTETTPEQTTPPENADPTAGGGDGGTA